MTSPLSFLSCLTLIDCLFIRGNNQFLKKQLELSHKNLKLSQEDHARQLNHLQVSVNRTMSPTRSQMMLMPSPLPSSSMRSSTSPIPSASSSTRRQSPNKAAMKQSRPSQQQQSRYFWQEEGEQDNEQPLEISTSPRYTDERSRMNANELMMSSEQTPLNQQQQQHQLQQQREQR
jgi:hypothetical protein